MTVSITRLTPQDNHYSSLLDDVLHGFTAYSKYLPSKYLYDARGSELFEEITQLQEYYLTRAELEILEHHADDIVGSFRPEELVELGSGSSRKTVLLVEALRRNGSGHRYVPRTSPKMPFEVLRSISHHSSLGWKSKGSLAITLPTSPSCVAMAGD